MSVKGAFRQGFPVSVSGGFYRSVGKGNGGLVRSIGEAIAIGVLDDLALIDEDGEGFTKGGGSHVAELAQRFYGNRSFELCHGLEDSLAGGLLRLRRDGGESERRRPGFDRQGQSRTACTKLKGDIVPGGGGAVFDGKE
jgi:hypothetical protein